MTIYADFRISVSGEKESTSGGDGGGTSSEITVNKHSAVNGNIQLYSDTTKLINPAKGTVYEAVVSGFDTEILYVEGAGCDITLDISNMFSSDISSIYSLDVTMNTSVDTSYIRFKSSTGEYIAVLNTNAKSINDAEIVVSTGIHVYSVIVIPGWGVGVKFKYPVS
ncbi:hypothetical protein MCH33_001682 [Salmonella enterica subsp. enterica serovar Agbeni]|nr:hypothetical protein [Salmonella enterica subsp. enterica serovar Aba]EHW9664676.1 hypothetical protein [Salmonella enterica subsp. enterica serovar Agbeni]EIW3215398.1 hypothetical protein [Salmonella enterica subsp. enterica serovar Agbeni]